MRTLRASGYRRMKWKNGGGETAEIAVFPPEADNSNFDWRVSMASVASDGPFSIFPGIDRTIGVLEGEGIELVVEGRAPVHLSPRSDTYSFPADAESTVSLSGGPILDLNVMTRRGAFVHTMRRIEVSGEIDFAAPGGLCVLVCSEGVLRIDVGRFAAELKTFDSLIQAMTSGRPVTLSGQGVAFAVVLNESAPANPP